MHSWREDTENAMGQQVDNITAMDGSSSPTSTGTNTPATLVANQPNVLDEKTGSNQASTLAPLDDQISSLAPGRVSEKNPFGLKPEYKTALRDFLVCLS
jgi:hypothetical protein